METKNIGKQTGEFRPEDWPGFWDDHPTPGRERRAADGPPVNADSIPRPIVVSAKNFAKAHTYSRHHHDRAQLVYASRGVMTVITDSGLWVVPPQRAVWVPSGLDHEVLSKGPLSMRNVYIHPDAVAAAEDGGAPRLPRQCCVVPISPLLREMILHAARLPLLYDEDGPQGRMMAVMLDIVLDQVRALPITPLHLPLSSHRRLKPVMDALTDTPADRRPLEQWAGAAAVSARTLARLFVRETGMTFGHWRQQVRLMEALRRLAEDQPVTTVALDLGYGSQSAFIAMFKRTLGRTPGKYFGD